MMPKQLKQLALAGAALAALALGGSALAGAATAASGSSATGTADVSSSKAIAVPLTSVGGGSVLAMDHVRDSWIHDLSLTDHERYLRHHQRLASKP